MDERPRSDVSDKYSWQCSNCKCRLSIRNKSFFFEIKVAIAKWLLMLYLWAREYPVSDAEKRLKFLQGWQSIYTSGCVKFVQPNYYRHRKIIELHFNLNTTVSINTVNLFIHCTISIVYIIIMFTSF